MRCGSWWAARDRSNSTTPVLAVFTSGQRGPLAVEPLAQSPALFRCFRRVDEVERVSRSETQAVGAERKRAEHRLPRSARRRCAGRRRLAGRGGPFGGFRPPSRSSRHSGGPASGPGAGCARRGPRRTRRGQAPSSSGGSTRRTLDTSDSLSASSANAWRDSASEARSIR